MLLTGRDRERGEAAVEEIRRRGGKAEFLQADFSSLRAVRGLAAEVAPGMRGSMCPSIMRAA